MAGVLGSYNHALADPYGETVEDFSKAGAKTSELR